MQYNNFITMQLLHPNVILLSSYHAKLKCGSQLKKKYKTTSTIYIPYRFRFMRSYCFLFHITIYLSKLKCTKSRSEVFFPFLPKFLLFRIYIICPLTLVSHTPFFPFFLHVRFKCHTMVHIPS